MIKTIQRPLACRNAHCGAMCSQADASFLGNPKKCYKYERRDDLYMDKAIPIPEGATNGDIIKAMFPNVEMVRQEISSTSNNIVVRDDSFLGAINRFHADWWNAPYKKG